MMPKERRKNPHILVVRIQPGGSGLVQVCCFCRPRTTSDRIGSPITGWERLSPDEISRAYSRHRRT